MKTDEINCHVMSVCTCFLLLCKAVDEVTSSEGEEMRDE
jgi:hypothetical protein